MRNGSKQRISLHIIIWCGQNIHCRNICLLWRYLLTGYHVLTLYNVFSHGLSHFPHRWHVMIFFPMLHTQGNGSTVRWKDLPQATLLGTILAWTQSQKVIHWSSLLTTVQQTLLKILCSVKNKQKIKKL